MNARPDVSGGHGYSGTSSVVGKVELSNGKGWASGRREEPVLVLGSRLNGNATQVVGDGDRYGAADVFAFAP